MKKDILDVEERIVRGEFEGLLTWLREKVHRLGKIYEPKELMKRITGEGLNIAYFVDYIKEKYSHVYNL
jgi:carboxypeptidase Taq